MILDCVPTVLCAYGLYLPMVPVDYICRVNGRWRKKLTVMAGLDISLLVA